MRVMELGIIQLVLKVFSGYLKKQNCNCTFAQYRKISGICISCFYQPFGLVHTSCRLFPNIFQLIKTLLIQRSRLLYIFSWFGTSRLNKFDFLPLVVVSIKIVINNCNVLLQCSNWENYSRKALCRTVKKSIQAQEGNSPRVVRPFVFLLVMP